MTRRSRQHVLPHLLTTAILLIGGAMPVLAQDGAYLVEPWLGSYSAVQIQPGDQKIIVAGSIEDRMAIARYDPFGNRDITFGIGGPSIPPLSGVSAPALGPSSEQGLGLVLQANGKAVVSGHNLANGSFAVARFNADGTLDNGFGSGGWNSLDARADYWNRAEGVGLQSTGKIVLAGWSGDSVVPNWAELARFTAAGVLDRGKGGFGQVVWGKPIGYTLNSFGVFVMTPRNSFSDVAVRPDDKLVAVGRTVVDNWNVLLVARYTANGTLDKSFNGGTGYSTFCPAGITNPESRAVALQSDGKIVVAGYGTGIDDQTDLLVVRFNANGTLDTTFGGGSGYILFDIDGTTTSTFETGSGVVIQPDGRIVVAGMAMVLEDGAWNPSNVLVVRLNANGTLDGTFGMGGFKIGVPPLGTDYHSFRGGDVALKSDGSIIVIGNDDWDSTDAYELHPLLMRFNP